MTVPGEQESRMITDQDIYLDITPIDLWRCGTPQSPTLDQVRIVGKPPLFRLDIKVDTKGNVGPNGGGISVFDNINPALTRGCWWKIPAGTRIPDGLYIRKDRSHAMKDIIHYTICPAGLMSFQQFQGLLRAFSIKAERLIEQAKVKL